MMLGGVSVRHLSPNPEVGWLQTPSRSSVNVINSIVQWCEACLAVVVVVVVVVVVAVVVVYKNSSSSSSSSSSSGNCSPATKYASTILYHVNY
jgi:hypothetical protein